MIHLCQITWILLLVISGKVRPRQPVDENKPFMLTRSKTFQVQAGGEVMFPCKVKNLGPMVVVWKYGNRVLTAGNLRIKKDPRIRLIYTNLMLSNVSREDAGAYTCEVETDQESPLIVVHKLNILVAPRIDRGDSERDIRVMAGSSVTLNCKADGFPKPKIDWRRSSGQIPIEFLSYDRTFLTLKNITRHEAGEYTCSAENGVGSPATHTITISVKHGPEVRADETIVYSGTGRTAELVCQVYASPTGLVAWSRNNAPVTQAQNIHLQTKGNLHSLTISNMTDYYFGNYTCRAINIFGRGETSILLTGTPEPPVVSPELSESWDGVYSLVWSCVSYSPVIKYRLKYQRSQTDEEDVEPPTEIIILSSETSTNDVYRMRHLLENLVSGGIYDGTVEAYNMYGWSLHSQSFQFTAKSVSPAKDDPVQVSTNPKTQSMIATSSALQLCRSILHIIGMFLVTRLL